MLPGDDATAEFVSSGRCWFRNALQPEQHAQFSAISPLKNTVGSRLSIGVFENRAAAAWTTLCDLAASVSPHVRPVRVLAFDKSPDLNWSLPWHQDRVIVVRERHNVPGFDHWSLKSGQWHCEPPASLLGSMMFARVHLDDASIENGALELALGTHERGRVASEQAGVIAAEAPRDVCTARAGDVLFCKMLTLHRSGVSRVATPRRALRVDFAAINLPSPLEWGG